MEKIKVYKIGHIVIKKIACKTSKYYRRSHILRFSSTPTPSFIKKFAPLKQNFQIVNSNKLANEIDDVYRYFVLAKKIAKRNYEGDKWDAFLYALYKIRYSAGRDKSGYCRAAKKGSIKT